MDKTAAVPQTEFYVETEAGRTFAWSAPNLSWLLRDLVEKGHRPKFIEPYAEYERKLNYGSVGAS